MGFETFCLPYYVFYNLIINLSLWDLKLREYLRKNSQMKIINLSLWDLKLSSRSISAARPKIINLSLWDLKLVLSLGFFKGLPYY